MSVRTRLLQRINAGDDQAVDDLLPLVYHELRDLAARQLRNERRNHTLQPTALVHEAYLRLVRRNTSGRSPKSQIGSAGKVSTDLRPDVKIEDQAQFFAAAAIAMRRILVDHARRRKRLKRGVSWTRVPVDLNQLGDESARLATPDYLLSLDEAVTQLKRTDPTAAELVHLRYFAGLSVEQAADALGISPRTASRTWNYARAWLFERITGKVE
ncbi:MAG: ECF-type sigma factor [Maioricimonas sp. JB045]|mgnify:CR=1 FL=1|uniref:ECF-type sigma factor n=1 Tax=Maioricimonas sp. JC845 TaxID=3232138 RepID=UPI00345A1E21